MPLRERREKAGLDRRQSLAGIPVFHQNVTLVETENDTVTLKLRVERGDSFLDRFRPPVTERTYELDEFGTFVVRHIDGRSTVMEIVRAFEQNFGMNHREAELGVVAFLKMLMKRSVLSVVIE